MTDKEADDLIAGLSKMHYNLAGSTGGESLREYVAELRRIADEATAGAALANTYPTGDVGCACCFHGAATGEEIQHAPDCAVSRRRAQRG
jgi:hypothetical protein